MSISELSAKCRGRWPEIVMALAPSNVMQEAIDRGARRHGFCPVHGGSNGDAFRVFKDFDDTGGAACNSCGQFGSGFTLINWLNGWTFAQTAKAIEDYLGDKRTDTIPARQPFTPTAKSSPTGGVTKSFLEEMWTQAVPLSESLARPAILYLLRRGFDPPMVRPFVSLRCHPKLGFMRTGQHGNETERVFYPAMLARLTDVHGNLVGMHRTYLTPVGEKAPEEKVKKMLVVKDASLSGAAIRLTSHKETLGISEGIENALAVCFATGMSVWAAASASLLANFEIPTGTRKLVVWADADVPKRQPNGELREPGRDAAVALEMKANAQNIQVNVEYPTRPPGVLLKMDWNDVFLKQGPRFFPHRTPEIAAVHKKIA